MKILWLTWKDPSHPDSGGAEVVLRELSQRLIKEGHSVTWLTCGYPGSDKHEQIAGVDVIRIGKNRYLHSIQALNYYVRHFRNQFDIVIEVVNTAPYFSVFFGKKSRRFLLYHQLARDVWFYETGAAVSQFGYYVFEPLATRLLSRASVPVITISKSTQTDLGRYGFQPERTHIISEGVEIEPLTDLHSMKKYRHPTVLSLGAMRAMKRTLDQIKAFEIAKKQVPDLQLKLAGDASGSYGQQVLEAIKSSKFSKGIDYLGKVSKADKIRLMQKSHLILQTAIKEGWGLTITEAASQGTPAVAYNVDGLRDSIRNNKTGLVAAANPQALADGIVTLLTNEKLYDKIRDAAWQWSKEITFDKSYKDFKQVVGI